MRTLLRRFGPTTLGAFTALMALFAPGAASAANQVQKNAYAYDVRIDRSDPLSPTVTYKLNASARAVTVNILVAGHVVATEAGGTAQTNSVKFDRVYGTGRLTAEVVVTSNTTTAIRRIADTPDQCAKPVDQGIFKVWWPTSLTINNCTDSPTFGRMVVTDGWANSGNAAGYYTQCSSSNGAGCIYAFDPQMQGIKASNGKYGFTGGKSAITNTDGGPGLTNYSRVRYSSDGRLFALSSIGGLYEFNPGNLNTVATRLLSDNRAKGFALAVHGTGANLKIAVNHTPGDLTLGIGTSTNWLDLYNIGTATAFSSVDASANAAINLKTPGSDSDGTTPTYGWNRNTSAQAIFDKDGKGLYFVENSDANSAADPGSLHIKMDGRNGASMVNQTPGQTVFRGSCAIAYNKDYTLAAIANSSSISLYTVGWPGNGAAPTFTKIPSGTIGDNGVIGANTVDLAFDYANNLYMVNSSASTMAGYQLPASVGGATTTTPSPADQAYTLNNAMVDDITATATLVSTTTQANCRIDWTTPARGSVAYYILYAVDGAGTADDPYVETLLDGRIDRTLNQYTAMNIPAHDRRYHVYAQMTNGSRHQSNITDATKEPAGFHPAPYITNLVSYDGYSTVTLDWECVVSTSAGYRVSYYYVKRDNVLVTPRIEAKTYVGRKVPDGMHSYTVTAVFNDGVERTSQPMRLTAPIHRDFAVTAYGLEEVYNYLIYPDNASWVAAGSPAKAVVAGKNGVPQNLCSKIWSTGGFGDLYRQAVYRAGKWYIAQLSDAYSTDGYIIPTPGSSAIADDINGTRKGHIMSFNADDPRSNWVNIVTFNSMLNQSIAADDDFGKKGDALSSHDPHLFIRWGANFPTDPDAAFKWATTGNAWLCPAQYLTDCNYKNNAWQRENIVLNGNWLDQTYRTNQIGRIHYLTADGSFTDHTSRIFMAANATRDVYVVDANYSKPSPNTPYKKFSAPSTETAGTENYAYPIVGRKDFVHVLRSNKVFYVNYTTGEYTPIYHRETNCYNAGGITFKYNGELFIVDPAGASSNNPGHFRIDMPQRPLKAGSDTEREDADHADFTNLVPMASFMQSNLTPFAAANANATSFGVEVDDTENCVYIYQYVPGQRFAKYKFYAYNDFPPIKPTLKMSIEHANDAADGNEVVKAFDARITWERPAEYAHSVHKNYVINHYEVRLLDANQNVVHQWSQIDPSADPQHFVAYFDNKTYNWAPVNCYVYDKAHNNKLYNGSWPGAEMQLDPVTGMYRIECEAEDANPDMRIIFSNNGQNQTSGANGADGEKWIDGGIFNTQGYTNQTESHAFDTSFAEEYDHTGTDFNLDAQTYTAEVTPVFTNTDDPTKTMRGETGYVIDQIDYQAGVDPINVQGFIDPHSDQNGQALYRVDIDFNAASRSLYPEPVSRFVLECKGPNDADFHAIPKLHLMRNTYDWYWPEATETGEGHNIDYWHKGYVWGNYNFGDAGTQFLTQMRRKHGTLTSGDKCFAGYEDEAWPVVGYYVTTENPAQTQYRVTAVYANDNPHIRKTASAVTTLGNDFIDTGVADLTADGPSARLSATPVPAIATLTVKSPEAIESIVIYSTDGAEVARHDGNGLDQQTIQVGELPNGVYMLRVNDQKPIRIAKAG